MGKKPRKAKKPQKKNKKSFPVSIDRLKKASETRISMVYESWKKGQYEQFSAVHRINGFPWRLRLFSKDGEMYLEVICDKSRESELWQCNANVTLITPYTQFVKNHAFTSWDMNKALITTLNDASPIQSGTPIVVMVATKDNGEICRLRPNLDLRKPLDVIIVVEGKKFPLNKESLASQSPFFRKLFNEGCKETKIIEYTIDDVEFKEFFNIIALNYRFDGASLTDENVHRMLELAKRFRLKVIEDKIVSFLLSSSSSFSTHSIHKRLLLSEKFKHLDLMNVIVKDYTTEQLADLSDSDDFDELSLVSLRVLFEKRIVDIFAKRESLNGFSTVNASHNCSSSFPQKKESTTISMVVEEWAEGQSKQLSLVHRFKGFPWRICIYKGIAPHMRDLSVICEKSEEAVLWKCTATIWNKFSGSSTHLFTCCDKKSQEQHIVRDLFRVGHRVEVNIETNDDGESWRLRPTLNPLGPRDGILVVGKQKRRFHVNKESLASQSPFFHRLFNDFMVKIMKEIPIGDVEYEEFSRIMDVLYGSSDNSLSKNNAEHFLQLASRFELKVVEDKVISFMVNSSYFPLFKKILLLDEYNLHCLMDGFLSEFNSVRMFKELSCSPEWKLLSKETFRVLFKKFFV